MSDLLFETSEQIGIITLNRTDKCNAFNSQVLQSLQDALDTAMADPEIKIICLKANGKHFSAGADLRWMQQIATFSEEENVQDAMVLGQVMHTLYHCNKPTLVAVQGAAFGGALGLIAAADIAIASHDARFCFSEVKLGLIPAVISPYVVRAIGERIATWLFMTADVFNTQQAMQFNLVHHSVEENSLQTFMLNYAQKILSVAPKAVLDCKRLVKSLNGRLLDENLMREMVHLIAEKRVSDEGQKGLRAFLNKEQPNWNEG